jgi:hypothetical protein
MTASKAATIGTAAAALYAQRDAHVFRAADMPTKCNGMAAKP